MSTRTISARPGSARSSADLSDFPGEFARSRRLGTGFRILVGVVLIGPVLIAIGISFAPVVEVVAVGGFTVAVAILGGYITIWLAPQRRRLQGALVALSSLALPVSMVLALGYGIGTFSGVNPLGLGISRMIALHGSLNALGFALLGTLGWRVAVPQPDR